MREEYKTTLGPKMKKILEMQKDIIKDLCYGEVNASDYEAGEIIAEKVLKNKLVD